MFVCLENVISSERLRAVQALLADPTLYESGARTAGKVARQVKDNLQGAGARPEIAAIIDKLRAELNRNETFRRIALPARFGRLMINRYEAGMSYGTHFDEAFIDGVRTDISFTLFLNDPNSYEGGELEITTATGAQAIKLPAGCAVVYPGDRLHRVRPVTAGQRDALVGWVQSRVRASEHRELLFDLASATAALAEHGDEDAVLKLRHVRSRLLRLWAEA